MAKRPLPWYESNVGPAELEPVFKFTTSTPAQGEMFDLRHTPPNDKLGNLSRMYKGIVLQHPPLSIAGVENLTVLLNALNYCSGSIVVFAPGRFESPPIAPETNVHWNSNTFFSYCFAFYSKKLQKVF